jgi:hypothetical protein
MTASSSAGSISCNGGTTTVTVSASGGTSPYTGTGSFTVGAGSYSYTVTDANGCADVTGVTISEPSSLSVSSSAGTISCNGGTTTVTVSASGGTAPYSGDGSYTVGAGTYSYTVSDANGCSGITGVTVTEPSVLSASSSAGSISCNGGSTTVTVSGSGGTLPYTGDGSYTVGAGTHSYTVTDANGCSAVTSVTVTEPSLLVASSSAGTISCNGGTTTATVSASGGTTPYTGTGSFTVGAGTHSYTVTDANGCSSITTVTVTEPSALSASSSAGAISCNGGTTTVTVSASGGTSPYSGDGSFTVAAGTYSYTVTDANGCAAVTDIAVVEPAVLSVSVAAVSATCPTCTNGSLSVSSVSGGTAPYSYSNLSGLSSGNYCITVTDANGCTASACATVGSLTCNLTSSAVAVTDILCNGDQATVSVTADNGVAPYSGTGDFTLGAGNHSFTITDANGCTATASITLTEPSALSATATVASPIACFGGTTVVNVVASGGTPSYIDDGAHVVAAGTWSFSVADANGCIATTNTVTITEPAKLQASVSVTNATCSNDGSMTASAVDGTAPYNYLWSNGATTTTISSLAAGPYTVTVTDDNGCTSTASGTVIQTSGIPAAPSAISGANGACRNSTLTFSVPAVSGATSYVWTLPARATGSSTTNSITVTFASNYNGGFLCVSAVNSCGSSAQTCKSVGVFTVRANYPGSIIGPSDACAPGTYTYSVNPVANASSYTWSVNNTLASIVSGQGTNTVQISFASGAVSTQIGVYASNCVGNSSTSFRAVYGTPVVSSPLTGTQFPCPNSTVTYSVNSVAGATGYFWSISGNAVITSQSGTTCTVSFGAGWTTGSLTVGASNTCGTGSRSYLLYSTPLQPGGITGPSTNLCNAAGVTSATYSISAVAGATSYTWTVPTGMSITGSSTGTSINVSISGSFVQGNVCVVANNSCGSSTSRCLFVTSRTSAPSSLTGPLTVCKSDGAVAYSITPVTGATSYSWSISGGAVITPSGTSATVNFMPSTTTSANMQVNANNACGASSPLRQTITVNLLCRTSDVTGSIESLTAYPNPTTGKVYVEFEGVTDARYLIRLNDLLGQEVLSREVTSGDATNSTLLDLTSVAKGVYLIVVQRMDGQDQRTIRLVVE